MRSALVLHYVIILVGVYRICYPGKYKSKERKKERRRECVTERDKERKGRIERERGRGWIDIESV